MKLKIQLHARLYLSIIPIFSLLWLTAPLNTLAQTNRIHTSNLNGWYNHNNSTKLNKKLDIRSEIHLRRHDLITDWQQYLLLGGLTYKPSDRVSASGFYTFVHSFPYGEYPARGISFENRFTEQLRITDKIGKADIIHRYRLEQRLIKFKGDADYKLRNRIRYMARASHPFNLRLIADHNLYGFMADELFIGFGENIAQNIFDQNRLSIGIGTKVSPTNSVEIGYMHQLIQQGNGRIFEHNHTLTLTVNTVLDLTKKD